MSTQFEPTCNLRLLRTSDATVRLQQWWQKTVEADDWVTHAIIHAAIPEAEGEWRNVPIVE